MNKLIAGGLLAASSLTGTANAATILDTAGPILATAPDAATINAKCDTYVSAIEARQKALESETGAATLRPARSRATTSWSG